MIAALSSSEIAHAPFATIAEISQSIRRREVSPVEIVRATLARIEKANPILNAFITVLRDEALRAAKRAEAEIAAGDWRGPLHGVPVGIKDMFDTADVRTTAAFEHFRHRVPAKDAHAVAQLKHAGAIIVGKTNMHRLAMGTTSLESAYGAVRNPWNRDFIAGGSSGGSAAAVAAGLCYATLDTDAIGSCRLPAACCGATGFKGTYGLIDNAGILDGEPVDKSILWLAHAAVTTRSAEDTMLVLNILAEPRAQTPDYRAALEQGGRLRLGAATNFAADTDVAAAFAAALKPLRGLGELFEVEAPLATPGLDVSNIEADRRAIAGALFRDIDVLVLPTTAARTPTIAQATGNPMALSAENTMFANYFGLPAISVPAGFDANGLPLGLQIVGKPWDELTVLRVAHLYQAGTSWSARRPSV
jgi:aspartyl-tRNA(Asn)/glutamyl-tRNA(Gln) amidotransferase subunit A